LLNKAASSNGESTVKRRGPNNKKANPDGLYEATIKTKTKIWSVKEMEDKVYIGAANNDYWFYPCYHDVNNKDTLEWWVIHS